MNVTTEIQQRARRWMKNVGLKERQEMLKKFLISKFKGCLTFGWFRPRCWSIICNFS